MHFVPLVMSKQTDSLSGGLSYSAPSICNTNQRSVPHLTGALGEISKAWSDSDFVPVALTSGHARVACICSLHVYCYSPLLIKLLVMEFTKYFHKETDETHRSKIKVTYKDKDQDGEQ